MSMIKRSTIKQNIEKLAEGTDDGKIYCNVCKKNVTKQKAEKGCGREDCPFKS